MKVIEVKINDKVVICEQLKDLTTAQFLEKQRKVAKFWQEQDAYIKKLEENVSKLQTKCKNLTDKFNDLQHQINVITGDEE